MTWFDDLVEDAMPYLATEEIAGTAGKSWQWTYTFDDAEYDPPKSASATCAIKRAPSDASSVVSVAVTFPAVNQVRCTVTPTASAAVPVARYFHELEIRRTSDGRCLAVVGGGDSTFLVKPEIG